MLINSCHHHTGISCLSKSVALRFHYDVIKQQKQSELVSLNRTIIATKTGTDSSSQTLSSNEKP